MLILGRYLALVAVMFVFVPFPNLYAHHGIFVEEKSSWDDSDESRVLSIDEAKSLIDDLPTAADAVSGRVDTDINESYYDIHGRQLAYRENSKEMRSSLEGRREVFESPRVEVINRYRNTIDRVYAAETAAYKNNSSENDDFSIKPNSIVARFVEEPLDNGKEFCRDYPVEDLVEKLIPSKKCPFDAPRRKVVTSLDAPDFDPSNLY